MKKETAIYASFYCKELEEIEIILKGLLNKDSFKRIEQGTVLLYEDKTIEFSIEYYNNSFYFTGRYKDNLERAEQFIKVIATRFEQSKIFFSIDYQEEYTSGQTTSEEKNITYKETPA
jgi:hypothetical protein